MDRRLFEFAVYSRLLLLIKKEKFLCLFLDSRVSCLLSHWSVIPQINVWVGEGGGGGRGEVSTTSPPRPGVYSGPGVKVKRENTVNLLLQYFGDRSLLIGEGGPVGFHWSLL